MSYSKSATSWEYDLAREVVIADGVTACKENIVAVMLWELTYWGFTKEDISETGWSFNNPYCVYSSQNPYTEHLRKLKQKYYDKSYYKDDLSFASKN